MKKQIPPNLVYLLSVALWLLAARPAVLAQSTGFTYHGQLTYKGALASGNYDLQFVLYDAEAGGALVKGPLPVNAMPVVNGLLMVRLDFGAGVFTGPPRWLEISVRPAGAGAFSLLTPRQEVTSSPYAIRAQTAGTAQDVSAGTVVKSLNNLKDNVTLAAGANVTITPNGNILTIGSGGAGGTGIWSVNNNDAYYIAGSVGIGTNKPSAGIQLEVSGNTRLTPAGGRGGYIQVGTPNGDTGISFQGKNRADIRYDGSILQLVAGTVGPPVPDNGITIDPFGNVGMGRNLSFGSQGRQMVNLWSTSYGIGIQAQTLYLRTGGGFAWHLGGQHSEATYDAGAGGTTLMTLDANGLGFGARGGQLLSLWSDPAATRYFGIGIQDSTLYNRCGGGGADGFAWFKGGIHDSRYHNGGGGQLLMTLDGNGLLVNGSVSVSTLTIRGGADLAEPFELSSSDIPKGSVVVIDSENAGKLKLSDQAYDQRVAGVVSGANGVNPGISLHQDGVLDSGQNVALSGRVYVLADAAADPIKAGDLLTTSDTPGHAMKAADHARAQGAILGKAMSSLKEGKGTVLVLVTLQ